MDPFSRATLEICKVLMMVMLAASLTALPTRLGATRAGMAPLAPAELVVV